ncbi:hypothetical protein SAMD00023353_3200020 [Rosellinia necatrix]|uniref:Uncharacterized protein n=1 Tax=Rosellinia necatrix TaxID=77044 RepID=A0A1W2TIG2_ROSNE|nr:hypothetical protein SAMD00023353_3200020 [Rosellinia necatrix]
MDVSTASGSDSDSDSNGTTSIQPWNDDVHIKNVPAFVVWRDLHGENHSLSDLNLSLVHTSSTNKALVQLQATTRLKKGPAKPSIYLFIKPDQIRNLAYVSSEDHLDDDQEDLHTQAREKLGASTHVLRFELQSPATFVVPTEHPFKFFRAGSQAVWTSWTNFARDAHCFALHFPMKALSKSQLLSFCQAASSHALSSLQDNITSLYGGKGGKVVDPNDNDEYDAIQTETRIGIPSNENTAPPAYEERGAAGPSLSTIEPPLCLSPNPDMQQSHKRRRRDSSTSCQDRATYEKGKDANDRILLAILGLQQAVNEAQVAHGAGIAKIMAKVEAIEERFKRLEEDQRILADEVRTHMAPLWDEMDARLQSQEDREHMHIRDVIEEVVDENIKEKMAEAIDGYFNNDDEGEDLIHKVIGKRIQEETKDYLQNQCFTGHFTITQEKPPLT